MPVVEMSVTLNPKVIGLMLAATLVVAVAADSPAVFSVATALNPDAQNTFPSKTFGSKRVAAVEIAAVAVAMTGGGWAAYPVAPANVSSP